MPAKNTVAVSQRPPGQRPTSAERRAAQIEVLSTRQAVLKQEAAARRLARSKDKDPSTR
jgi:hypothetical protein